jgi:BRCT domain type II-containing protein
VPYIPPPRTLRYELKNLRLTPPPTYSDEDEDEKFFANDAHTDAGEISSESESDGDEDVYRPSKPIMSKSSTKKRKKPVTSKRKAEKISKSKSGTKTPSTQALSHPSRASVLPPYVEVIDLSRDNVRWFLPSISRGMPIIS